MVVLLFLVRANQVIDRTDRLQNNIAKLSRPKATTAIPPTDTISEYCMATPLAILTYTETCIYTYIHCTNSGNSSGIPRRNAHAHVMPRAHTRPAERFRNLIPSPNSKIAKLYC